jgi:osmotically-inducible protein OsmY
MFRSIAKAAALVAVLTAMTPIASAASPQETDLTNTFIAAGVTVDRLQVYEIAGVVLIRGRVQDKAQAAEASRVAQSLGYTRVANLIQVNENRDREITRRAEIELTVNRSLDGCKFSVTSEQGHVKVAGLVKHELQKDVAAQVLKDIDGIESVVFTLTRF